MENLTKKLSMKKTFFVTQLESFFSTITSEYNQKLSSYEIENKVLKQENEKLKYDVDNLIKIKNNLTYNAQEQDVTIQDLKNELVYIKEVSTNEQNLELIRENNKLKKLLAEKEDEVKESKDKLKSLQNFASKSSNPYNQSILNKKNEEIVKEITESLRK